MILTFVRYGAELNVEDYRLFAMALTQRYVKPTKEIFVILIILCYYSVSQPVFFYVHLREVKDLLGKFFHQLNSAVYKERMVF